jgi:hypothetical protein
MNFDQLIKYYGGEMKAAAEIGVSHQTIKNWKNSKDGIPRTQQLAIQTLTHNKLKADRVVAK